MFPRPASAAIRLSHDAFAWALAAGLTLLLVLSIPMLAGRDYLADDLAAFHYPARAFYAEQLARGEPFDWMPSLYCGFYLTGEGQAGTYHPWHWLLYRLFPLHAAAGVEWLSAFALMLPGMWLWLARITGRREAAMLGSLVFAFGSFNLLHFVHPNAIAVVAHLPWLLWATDIVLRDARRWRVVAAQAAIALLTGSQLLIGYPQYVWFSLVTLVAYTTFIVARPRPGRLGCEQLADCGQCIGCTRSTWPRVAIAVGIGALLGGVQLLPTIDALTHSARSSAGGSFANWGSLNPLNVIQLVSPYYFSYRVAGENTHELGMYLGMVPLVLATWALTHWRRLGSLGPLAWAATAFGVFAIVMAFGQYTPLYRLQSSVPVLQTFRFPCRYIVLFELAASVLATLGFVLLVDQARQAATEREANTQAGMRPLPLPLPISTIIQSLASYRALWVLWAMSLSVAITGVILQRHIWVASVGRVLLGPLLLIGAIALFIAAARGWKWALIGLIVYTAADLGIYGLSYAVYPARNTLDGLVASTLPPPGPRGERIVCDFASFDAPSLRTGNLITLAGWPRADGYAGLEPKQAGSLDHIDALRAAGVRWVLESPASAKIEGLESASPRWREVPDPLPRVRFAPRGDHATSDAANATIAYDRPGRLIVRVDARGPQWLKVAESYHSGWKALVDGQPRSVVCADEAFLGVPVGANDRTVVLEFRPKSLAIGWMTTALGAMMLCICIPFGACSSQSLYPKALA